MIAKEKPDGLYPVWALLAVAFLACLFLPKEATSDSERRKLAAMPAFTLDTVLSGRFMSGFETYTQDHFPSGTSSVH